jgi:flagellin
MPSFGDYNRVNTNVTAMEAQLSLNKINRDLGESRLRLSTGSKINNAEDDAAGFAIATKLKSRVAGLEQALQNVSDAKSVLDIVEGAYGSIMDNLIEMKTLSLQATSDTTSSTEKTFISKQIRGLSDDINSIVGSTSFNNIQLLDGDSGDYRTDMTLTFQVGESTDDSFDVILSPVNIFNLFGDGSPVAPLGKVDPNDGTDNDDEITVRSDDTVVGLDGDNVDDIRGEIEFLVDGSNEVVADYHDYSMFTSKISEAINSVNSYINQIGISQKSLSGKEENLTQSITANNAAKSRIMDTDFAKEQSNSIRLQILQQTATAALSQANMGPQAVLGFLGQ